MKAHKIGYFDVVGRALPKLVNKDVGKAIERLSATYREGRADLDFTSEVGRAAYLYHLLPAHVCDLARLLRDVPHLLDDERAELHLIALGAGPGTEALALLEAVSAVRASGGLEGLRRVRITRVDHHAAWDPTCAALLDAQRPFLLERDPDLGTAWTLEVEPRALVADLSRPLPDAVLAAVRTADVVIAANFISEVAPRGTPELPGELGQTFTALAGALPAGAHVLLVDRQNAPGVEERLAAAAAAMQAARPDSFVDGPRPRQTRCGCALTRLAKQIYDDHVRLPTTRDKDRPALNCQTLWWHLVIDAGDDTGADEDDDEDDDADVDDDADPGDDADVEAGGPS